jgi:hypothetical protein
MRNSKLFIPTVMRLLGVQQLDIVPGHLAIAKVTGSSRPVKSNAKRAEALAGKEGGIAAAAGKGGGINAVSDLVVEVKGSMVLKLRFQPSLAAAKKEAEGMAHSLRTKGAKQNYGFCEAVAAVVGLTAKSAVVDSAVASTSTMGGGEGVGLVKVEFRLQVVHKGKLHQCQQVTMVDQTLAKIEGMAHSRARGGSVVQQAEKLEQELAVGAKAKGKKGRNSECSDAKRVEATLDMLLSRKSTKKMLAHRLQAKHLSMKSDMLAFEKAHRVNMVLRRMEQQAQKKVLCTFSLFSHVTHIPI